MRVRLTTRPRPETKFAHRSESNEWYTPHEVLDLVVRVLGRIDLDPASCAAANDRIDAATFFTIEDDGLSKNWWGRVFMNPPYGRGASNKSNQDLWTQRLIAEYDAGHVEEAIVVVNAVTGQDWFQRLWRFPICFAAKRIAFLSASGARQRSPTHSNALVYLGPAPERFERVMKQLGRVVRPMDAPPAEGVGRAELLPSSRIINVGRRSRARPRIRIPIAPRAV